jgi:hypothetical protein
VKQKLALDPSDAVEQSSEAAGDASSRLHMAVAVTVALLSPSWASARSRTTTSFGLGGRMTTNGY